MWTLGVDIGKRRHHATLLDEEGRIVWRDFSFAQRRDGFDALQARLQQSGVAPSCLQVGMEATGSYWMGLFEQLSRWGYSVQVLNPLVVAARRNVTIRGTKTDGVDSWLIAHVLHQESPRVSAVPSPEARSLRDLTRLRYACAQTAIAEKQRLVGLLDRVFPEYADHFSDLFGTTSRQVLSQFPTAEDLAQVDLRRLTRLLQQASRGRMGREQAQRLKAAAQQSIGRLQSHDTLALEIRFGVERLNLLLSQIDRLDEQVATQQLDQPQLLQSIPGLGPVWAPTVWAEIQPVFQPQLKQGARKLVAAAGLDVRRTDSGEKVGPGKMSKRGSKYLRTAIMQAAEVAVFRAHDPLFTAVYQRQRERGKHHTVAMSHVAHKMLHVIFSVLKNQRPYTPMLPC